MKRNTLTTAVLAGLTGIAGMAGVANAVNVNPDGLGQVLLYPYYTARGENDTLISIVNTTERGKAVKIRFIEALNSREVLDFNIYMSPYDVWTAAVTAEGEGGKMVTYDNTCTVPYFAGGDGEQAFLEFGYAGDGGPQGIERTASGYIEVIEMGTMVPQPLSEPGPTQDAIIPWSAKHVNGEPRSCARFVAEWTDGAGLFWLDGGNSEFGFDTEAGATGGLFGSASIINVADGTLLSYNATAVDGFWAPGDMSHTRPESVLPDLSDGTNTESYVFDNGSLVNNTWSASSLLALNATLTLERLMNEYISADSVNAQTEWVLTLPTKRFHVDPAIGDATANNPIPPFTRTWHVEGGTLNVPCEDMEYSFWDREERVPDVETGPPTVSPQPPPGKTPQFQLCREANVVRFSSDGSLPEATEILKEPVREGEFELLGYTNFDLPFDAGWVLFDLAEVPDNSDTYEDHGPRRQSVVSDDGFVVEGLPVIGFQATTYTNGQLEGGAVLANYGGSFNHRGSRSIVVSD